MYEFILAAIHLLQQQSKDTQSFSKKLIQQNRDELWHFETNLEPKGNSKRHSLSFPGTNTDSSHNDTVGLCV